MSGETELTPVGQILVARLLVSGEKGATGAEIRKSLEPLVGHRWAGAALTDRVSRELNELVSSGLVALTRDRKTERAALTMEGRRRALDVLGLDGLPPKTTWDKLKKTYLAALALGLPTPSGPAAKLFGGEPGFKAALLRGRFDLPIGQYPKLQDALNALAWRQLGFEPLPKFSVKALQAALILREVDGRTEVDPKGNPGKEVAKLLAREVGARKSGKDELRTAAIRQWVDGGPVASVTSEPVPERATPMDLNVFALRVLAAARSSETGRFGDGKVFVTHVWRALRDDPDFAGMDLGGFKQRLAEANNARLLNLSRADMVEAMDPEDVRLSEISYQGATFHFVRF